MHDDVLESRRIINSSIQHATTKAKTLTPHSPQSQPGRSIHLDHWTNMYRYR